MPAKIYEILSVEDREIISELAHIGLDELRIRGFEPWAKARVVLADFDAGTYHIVSANG
jgi:hypothetical protein